jgi:hypothetical protein
MNGWPKDAPTSFEVRAREAEAWESRREDAWLSGAAAFGAGKLRVPPTRMSVTLRGEWRDGWDFAQAEALTTPKGDEHG